MITLTIDGKEVVTQEGKTILEAARQAGIYIPTLCYHEELLPIASCRLCVVEVEGYEKPMTACNTLALAGISVYTNTERIKAMREEFLKIILTNHPLDCPQCDKGGECRLQDLVYEQGIEKAPYFAERKLDEEAYATPLIRYWPHRCILCGRCVRACREISGRRAIDISGKGFSARITPTESTDCISCGECLSLCPVGALTEALSPIKSRPWQSEKVDTTCCHCGFGCRLTMTVLNGEVITKVVSESPTPPNFTSLCVRGRFGFDFVENKKRLKNCEHRRADGVFPLSYSEAMSIIIDNLKRLAGEGKGIGILLSPRVTNEEVFLLVQLARQFNHTKMASSAYYHTGRAMEALRKAGIDPSYDYEKIGECDTLIVAGAGLLINNHVLANQIRKAVKLKGIRLIVVDPLPGALTAIADVHLQVNPKGDASLFNAFSCRLLQENLHYNGFAEGFGDVVSFLKDKEEDFKKAGINRDDFEKAYRLLKEGTIGVIFGSGITDCEGSLAALINFCLLRGIDENGLVMPVSHQANARGVVALVPELLAPEELINDDSVASLIIYEDDPFSYLPSGEIEGALRKKEFIALCDLFPSFVYPFAHLLWPASSFVEKEGTFLSGDGKIRELKKVLPRGSFESFDFLRELLFRLGGKNYARPTEVTQEINEGNLLQGVKRGRRYISGAVREDALKDGEFYLIRRDFFMNHHLDGKETYGRAMAKIGKEELFMSPDDAQELMIGHGQEVSVETERGSITLPVTLKKGMKRGILEIVLFRRRTEMLNLSTRPDKVIKVKLRKA